MILCRQLLLLLFVIITLMVKAQDKHFVYIQSDKKQPFYVQLNNQTYSSTTTGYLIIPQLTKGKYYLVVGFVKNSSAEQKFIIDIADRDAGFSLKQVDPNNWGLFDIVYLNTIMAEKEVATTSKEDLPALLPSVKDTATNNAAIVVSADKPTPIADTVAKVEIATPVAMVTKDTLAVAVQPTTKLIDIPVKAQSIAASATNNIPKINATPKSKIAKTFEKIAEKGIDQIYIDNSNNKKSDTIAILIPLVADTQKINKPQQPKPVVAAVSTTKLALSKKCEAIATNDDFYKLRLAMAAATNDSAMILAATNFFKSTCFSIEQIKNLGFLFLSEESRFHFFQAAKSSITDAQKYPSLQLQFTQPLWIERFRALVNNN